MLTASPSNARSAVIKRQRRLESLVSDGRPWRSLIAISG